MKIKGRRFARYVSLLTAILVIASMVAVAAPASANVTAVAYTDVTSQINADKTVKVSSAASPLLRIDITNDATDVNLTLVKVQFASVSGFDKTDLASNGLGAATSDGLLLYKDVGVANTFESVADTFLATTNVWDGLMAQMTLVTPLALGASAPTKYFVVVRTSATAANGDKFTANMGLLSVTAGGVQYGTGALTTATVTVDDAAPTIPAANIVGTTIQGAGDTIAITFSESVRPGTADYGNGAGKWGPSIFSAIESPDGTAVVLAGATTSVTNSSTITSITITLADDAANKALINGNTIAVTPEASAIQDLAGNFMAVTEVVGSTATIGDTVAPGISASNIIGATGAAPDEITITFSEKIRAAADQATWRTWLTSIQSPDGTEIAFANATFSLGFGTGVLTITLSEAAPDSAYLTNGNVVAVTPAANKIKDLAGNPLPATEVVGTTAITGDTTVPAFSSAAFTKDTNLDVTFGENLKAVDASKLSSTSFTVASATVDSTTKTIVHVTISGLSQANQNGVSGANGLQLAAGAVTDLAGNSSALEANKTIAADTTAPTITSATLNYGTGVLTITANEKLDATPGANVTVGIIRISNVAGSNDVTLAGATVTETDGATITITLTAAQKAAAIAISGVAGGDGGAVVLDVDASAVRDMNNRANAEDDDNPVTEASDTVKPAVSTVTAATLDYGTGFLVMTFDEFIDLTPGTNADLSKIWISNTSGSHNVVLTGATVTETDGVTLTLELTAAQKAAAIVISGKPGGDGGAVVVDLDAGAVKDLAGNLNDLSNGNAVAETADGTASTFASAKVTSATNIDVTFNEGMKNVAASGSEFTSAAGRWTATAAAIDATDKTIVHVTVTGIDSTEERGIAADMKITRSTLTDLAGNAYTQNITNGAIDDGISPTFTIAYYTDAALTTPLTLDYMNGGDAGELYYIKITASEPLTGTPTITINAEGTAYDVTNAATTSVGGSTTVFSYIRTLTAANAAALGDTAEVITITGTDDAVVGTDNISANAAVTGEKKIDAAVATGTLSTPANATSTGDNTPTLTWNAVTDNNEPVTYRVQVDNENTFAAPTVVDQTGLSVLTYTLPTAVADGTYYWRVSAIDSFGNVSTSNIWSFVVAADSTAPSVTVTHPNGGESLNAGAGTSATITWSATDSVTPSGSLSISLSYSSDGGTTWTAIGTGTYNGAYVWTPLPSITSTQVLVKVSATDAAGNVGSDTSNNVFSITVPGTAITSVTLVAGWNLISLPRIPVSSVIATVLTGITGIEIVWSYDPVAYASNTPAGWASWIPDIGGDLGTMVDGKAYWIKIATATADQNLSVYGANWKDNVDPGQTPKTYNVTTGWNLVGFRSATDKTNGAYLTGTSYRFPIYGYTGAAYFNLTASSDSMQAGKGYWVYFNADGIISP